MPTSSEARLDSDWLNSKLCCFVTHLTGIPSSQFTSIYLSIFLYVLTPEGDIRRTNQVLGVSLFFFFFFFFSVQCAMLVVLVVSERSQCLPYNAERQAR